MDDQQFNFNEEPIFKDDESEFTQFSDEEVCITQNNYEEKNSEKDRDDSNEFGEFTSI